MASMVVRLHNDGHHLGRQASDITHELGHGLLVHQPAPALSIVGCRDWDAVLEEEANWLGAALLISDEAAIHISRSGMSMREAAVAYGVSEQMVRMRVNVTGAVARVRRSSRPTISSTSGAVRIPVKSNRA
jgi:Zn-dependent peptidase ImmA (M78 family)